MSFLYGALLHTIRSISLYLTEHVSVCYGACLYIPIEACSVGYGGMLHILQGYADAVENVEGENIKNLKTASFWKKVRK